ncbi:1-deoxy-D-xylulose-5-phosphate synthase [Saccharicrinis sp. FJH2]|uniref:1-deoxy-D-xylulose-5-phosphate synthase n=1 Tax=Saccharicrinis sp. FJH65 TaxID=3344659 RepID=UPI0035F2384D
MKRIMTGGYRHLKKINFPSDLRKMDKADLPEVCDELRQYIIDVVSCNPGHFGASLGTVELTVALHYVFNTPDDRIVWDVGHQAYGHKILTGRREQFHTNRKLGGISGFPNIFESEYDTFGVGHSSTSISAALGMAIASGKKGDKRQVIAVIGDGALTGGMAYEALNNATVNPNNLLIILNDNEMAISPNVGGITEYLLDISTSKTYNKMRSEMLKALSKMNVVGDEGRKIIVRVNNTIKALLARQGNIFEGFNIRYFGPVDGHDVLHLEEVLRDLKNIRGPKVLHIKTKKGKGFEPAENSQTEWHAPGMFDKNTGLRIVDSNEGLPPKFQDVFGKTILELAREDKRIVGITPAMTTGSSLDIMMKEMPNRVFDVGIAEQHAVTFSAGMAKEGFVPFCNIYSTFMQRAYDQLIHDVALQKLHVVFCLDRGGLVGEDGATHHGVFDLAYLRCVPNLIVSSPLDEMELRNLMFTALNHEGPFAIRYPRGKGINADWEKPMKAIKIGTGECIKKGHDVAILSMGPLGIKAKFLAEKLEKEGISVAVYNMRFVKPLDEKLLHEIMQNFNKVITLEDGTITGGFGSAILEFNARNGYAPRIKLLGVPDKFIEHGSVAELHHICGYDTKGIKKAIKELTANPL